MQKSKSVSDQLYKYKVLVVKTKEDQKINKNKITLKNFSVNKQTITPMPQKLSQKNNRKKQAFFNEYIPPNNSNSSDGDELLDVGPIKSPVYYLQTKPPGITPQKYEQKLIFKQNNDNYQVNNDNYQVTNDNYQVLQTINNQNVQNEQAIIQQKQEIIEKLPPQIQNVSTERFQGTLKFFDPRKNYGFIIGDKDNKDIFVHYDDLQLAGISKDQLKKAKKGFILRFSFLRMVYIGRYEQSSKAVEIKLLSISDPNKDKNKQM